MILRVHFWRARFGSVDCDEPGGPRAIAGRVLATLLLAGMACAPAYSQRLGQLVQQQRRAERQAQRQQLRPPAVVRPPVGGAPRPIGPGANNLPPAAIARLQQLPPEKQEQFLQNNKRFQNLPPQQQALIRQRLQQWNRLTPSEREEIRQRQQVWDSMTPQQRTYVTQTLLPRWQALPPSRRQAIMQHLHQLRDLSESDRNARLNDPAFVQGMNPEDRETLNQLAHLHVGTTPDVPPL